MVHFLHVWYMHFTEVWAGWHTSQTYWPSLILFVFAFLLMRYSFNRLLTLDIYRTVLYTLILTAYPTLSSQLFVRSASTLVLDLGIGVSTLGCILISKIYGGYTKESLEKVKNLSILYQEILTAMKVSIQFVAATIIGGSIPIVGLLQQERAHWILVYTYLLSMLYVVMGLFFGVIIRLYSKLITIRVEMEKR